MTFGSRAQLSPKALRGDERLDKTLQQQRSSSHPELLISISPSISPGVLIPLTLFYWAEREIKDGFHTSLSGSPAIQQHCQEIRINQEMRRQKTSMKSQRKESRKHFLMGGEAAVYLWGCFNGEMRAVFDSRDGARSLSWGWPTPSHPAGTFPVCICLALGRGALHPSLSIKPPQLLSDIFLCFFLSFFVSYHTPKFPSEGEHFPWKFHFRWKPKFLSKNNPDSPEKFSTNSSK